MCDLDAHNYSKKSFVINSNHSESEYETSQYALEDSFDYILIQKIKSNKCLYNNKIKKSSGEKSNIWKTIATDLNETVEVCQKRWKRLREYFCKERNKRSSDNVKRNSWHLYDAMLFVSPFIIKKQSFVKVNKAVNLCPPQSKPQISSTPQILNEDTIEEVDSYSLQTGISDNSQLIESEAIDIEFPSLIYENPTISPKRHTSSPILDGHSTSIKNLTPSSKVSYSPNNPTVTSRNVLDNITASLNNNAALKQQEVEIKTKYKDEENSVIADLVTQRLKKIQDEEKKNKLIRSIFNIIFE